MGAFKDRTGSEAAKDIRRTSQHRAGIIHILMMGSSWMRLAILAICVSAAAAAVVQPEVRRKRDAWYDALDVIVGRIEQAKNHLEEGGSAVRQAAANMQMSDDARYRRSKDALPYTEPLTITDDKDLSAITDILQQMQSTVEVARQFSDSMKAFISIGEDVHKSYVFKK